jgi:hypothetical protein
MVLFVCDKDPIIFLSDLVVCPFLAEQRRQKTVLPSVAGEFHQHNGSTFTLTILYVFIQCAVLVGLSIKNSCTKGCGRQSLSGDSKQLIPQNEKRQL